MKVHLYAAVGLPLNYLAVKALYADEDVQIQPSKFGTRIAVVHRKTSEYKEFPLDLCARSEFVDKLVDINGMRVVFQPEFEDAPWLASCCDDMHSGRRAADRATAVVREFIHRRLPAQGDGTQGMEIPGSFAHESPFHYPSWGHLDIPDALVRICAFTAQSGADAQPMDDTDAVDVAREREAA